MERLIFSLYGFWFWLTRKYRAARYGEAADTLKDARLYLLNDFTTRASTRDRGYMLAHQVEALALLERHSSFASQTSRRFASLNQCCKFIVEELAEPQTAQAVPQPAPLPHEPRPSFWAPIAASLGRFVSASLKPLPTLLSFLASDTAGAIGDLRQTRWRMSQAFVPEGGRLSRFAAHGAKPQVQ